MVAYSFHKSFHALIKSGRKRQTIRRKRKRHARVGEPVQLYGGMRTRYCHKLLNPDPICIAVEPIRIWVPYEFEPAMVALAGRDRQPISLDFATDDGFDNPAEMVKFWLRSHGPGLFDGFLIRWDPDA